MKPWFLALSLAVPVTASAAAPQSLSVLFRYHEPGAWYTDGITLGSNPGVVIVAMGDGDQTALPDNGRTITLNLKGQKTSFFDSATGTGFGGVPLAIESDATKAGLEYLVQEDDAAGSVYIRHGNSTPFVASGPYEFPANANMGSAEGEVIKSHAGTELVVVDYAGHVNVLDKTTMAVLATYNTFSSDGQLIDGVPALADLNNNGVMEIVLAGAGDGSSTEGRVLVLTTGVGSTISRLYQSDLFPNGGFAQGSSPAIGDIDGDGKKEIVVTPAISGEVLAFNLGNSSCRYRWTAPGGGIDYYWTSPVIGDVATAHAGREVVVEAVDGVVSVLTPGTPGAQCSEGNVLWSHTVGTDGNAWFTPALANLYGGAGSKLDIVAASYLTVEVLDVDSASAVYDYSDATMDPDPLSGDGFWPTAIVTNNGKAGFGKGAMMISGYGNGRVYHLTTPAGQTTDPGVTAWNTYGQNNQRTGSK